MEFSSRHIRQLALLFALGACHESLSSSSATAGALALQLPDAAVLAAPRMDVSSVSTLVQPPSGASEGGRLSSHVVAGLTEGSTEGSSEFDRPPSISGAKTTAWFHPYNGKHVAVAEGYMTYWATHAEHLTTATVGTPSGSLLTASEPTYAADFLPATRGLQSYARVPLVGDCGYSLQGSTVHKAWHQVPVPGPWSGGFGHAYDNSISAQVRMADCLTQIKTTTGTGGEGDSRITDSEWYICYWYVWYDSSGVEVTRQLLYCRPE